MVKELILISCFMLASHTVFASKRDAVVSAIKEQCSKDQAAAEKLATPGRTGTITKFLMCLQPTVKVSDDCTVKCKSASGNVVGN